MGEGDTLRLFILRHGQSELNHENIFCGWIDAHLTKKGRDQARVSARLIKAYCENANIAIPQVGFTSRLVRTQETMESIADELNMIPDFHIVTNLTDGVELIQKTIEKGKLRVLQTWRLNERHYGSWQGRRKPDVLKECGKDNYMFVRRDYLGRPPDADLDREMIDEHDDKGSLTGYYFKEPNRKQMYKAEEAAGIQLPSSESLFDVVQRSKPFLDKVIIESLKSNGGCAIVVGHGSTVRSILKVIQNISDEEIKDLNIPNGIPLVIELNPANKKFIRQFYLDPESAKISAELVRNEGFA
ncbi:HBR195Cp [Eremothecium sinecaudum]|uniref:Phosphoglycerate mutase n=1 Tax=Eremothecium sinecaudum TaxID=45286 RepID=A0A120K187_9SACH|nr:HBR195Cp [Eremothecium sinecaudum]AMD19096.1 HBR195Cp [Eremothecium sinecaudum]